MNNTFGKKYASNRIRKLRKNKGVSQQTLADYIGVTQATLSGWETCKFKIDNTSLFEIADYFEVSIDYLLGRDADAAAPGKRGVKIPVLGRVQAGIPIEAVEEILDYEEITEELAKTGEFFALAVKGDSMEPQICEGDVVVVRRQDSIDSGDIAIVLVNGDDATIKKVRIHDDGISLIPLNATYSPIFYTTREIDELPVLILGKVAELRRKF